jgi:hypothetical protein
MYSNLKVSILKAICDERGIPYKSKIRKQKLIKLIEESDLYEALLVKIEMSSHEYATTIAEIKNVAELIDYKKSDGDGRTDSAVNENPFLIELKKMLLDMHPDWKIIIAPPRDPCDIIINNIRINLKLTDCKSADNSVSKPSIYFSITGRTDYSNYSNWNQFYDKFVKAKSDNHIKTERHKPTEYHYLVKNKKTGDVLLKPIFDIHTYFKNASNDLQINWKIEFANASYSTKDSDYLKKVKELLTCIQTSVKEKIERTERFANADLSCLFS